MNNLTKLSSDKQYIYLYDKDRKKLLKQMRDAFYENKLYRKNKKTREWEKVTRRKQFATKNDLLVYHVFDDLIEMYSITNAREFRIED